MNFKVQATKEDTKAQKYLKELVNRDPLIAR